MTVDPVGVLIAGAVVVAYHVVMRRRRRPRGPGD
jgi:hypothetical protein